jgi:hypothetical protein
MKQQTDRSSQRARTLLTAIFIMGGFALVAERAGYAGAYRGTATAQSIGIQLLLAAPTLAYLGALWQFRALANRVARGEGFAVPAALALRRAGLLLGGGAFLSLLAVGPLHRAAGVPYARLIDLDVSTLIIGAIGLALFLVARLIDRARAVQSELDEIF